MNVQGIGSRQAPEYSSAERSPARSTEKTEQKNASASQAASRSPEQAGSQNAAPAPAATPDKTDVRSPTAAMPTGTGKFANSVSNNAQGISFRKPVENPPAAQAPTRAPARVESQDAAAVQAPTRTPDKTETRQQGEKTPSPASAGVHSTPGASASGLVAKTDGSASLGVKWAELPAQGRQIDTQTSSKQSPQVSQNGPRAGELGQEVTARKNGAGPSEFMAAGPGNDVNTTANGIRKEAHAAAAHSAQTATPVQGRGSDDIKGHNSDAARTGAGGAAAAQPQSGLPAGTSNNATTRPNNLGDTASYQTTDRELSPGDVAQTNAGKADINQNFIASGEAVGRGFDGRGITVGIVSDSFDDLGGGVGSYAEDVESRDLPEDIRILREDQSITNASGGDEGRAMAQVVHDIAPRAELVFHSAFNNGGGNIGQSIAAAIDNLVADGVDIIADDTNMLTAPVYQRGPHAQAIDRAAEAGVPVFSSAGNSADNAIERTGDWTANQADQANSPLVEYQPGETAKVTLHWDDPYPSISDEGNVPTADFSLALVQVTENGDFLLDENGAVQPVVLGTLEDGTPELAIFDEDQNQTENSADPFEFLAFENNTGEVIRGRLVAQLVDGEGENRTTRMTFFEGTVPAEANSSPLLGAALAENGIQVGAVNLNSNLVEGFSSVGPSRLLFDDQGNRLENGGQLAAVDIAAPDGVNTTHFGQDTERDPDEYPNFFGTSAAAPYAAASAAIILSAVGDSVPVLDRPEFIRDILTQTAKSKENEPQTGVGIINVQSAISAIPFPLVQPT